MSFPAAFQVLTKVGNLIRHICRYTQMIIVRKGNSQNYNCYSYQILTCEIGIDSSNGTCTGTHKECSMDTVFYIYANKLLTKKIKSIYSCVYFLFLYLACLMYMPNAAYRQRRLCTQIYHANVAIRYTMRFGLPSHAGCNDETCSIVANKFSSLFLINEQQEKMNT